MRGMAETPHEGTVIISVQQAMHVLEIIGSCPHGATAGHIAAETGLTASAVAHHLHTLTHEGYAIPLPGDRWILGDHLDLLAHGRHQQQTQTTRPRP